MSSTPEHPRVLWHHRDFLRLWSGQTVALFGAQITLLALPLTAIQLLDASPSQLGVLSALGFLPVFCVTLLAGVLADRVHRRPLLIASNVGRAVALSAVPIAAWTGHLSIALLYAVAFLTGIFTAQFDVAYQAYLPTLIDKQMLVEGNSKLQSSQSVAQTAGQGLGGVLIQVLTAPVAVLVNALAYLVSVVSLTRIRAPEPPRVAARRSVRAELAEGLRVTLAQPVLTLVMAQAAWFNLLWVVVLVVMPLYGIRTLGLGEAGLGLVIAAGSAGAFAGSLIAGRLGVRLGTGRAMAYGMLLASAAVILLPSAAGGGMAGIAILVAGYVLNGLGLTVFNVHSVALRQSLVPVSLTGRVSALFRFAGFAVVPVGSFCGGLLAEDIGPRATLAVVAAGLVLGAVVFVALPAVRRAGVPAQGEPTLVPRRELDRSHRP